LAGLTVGQIQKSQKRFVAAAQVNKKLKTSCWQPIHKGRRVVREAAASTSTVAAHCSPPKNASSAPRKERNPGFTRDDYAQVFRNYLGATQVLLAAQCIAGDDTHGHVDDLALFVNPTTIVR